MLEIIREITLDVSEENRFTAITAKQYDSRSRYLLVRLTDRGEALTLPDTASVLISATRPDGLSDGFEGLVQDGAALVPLDYWMLMLDGTVTCELVVTGADGYRLTTMSFALDVRHSCFGDGLTPGGNHGVYVRLLHEIEDLKKKIGEGLGGSGTVTDEQIYAAVEKYLTEHPLESPEAEKAAESAKKSADEAEESAKTAAEASESAESFATAAGTAQEGAVNAKQDAETAANAAADAKSAAESARDQAKQSETDAANSAGTASTAAANATSAKTAAETAKGEAQTAADEAGESASQAASSAEAAYSSASAAQTAKEGAETAKNEAAQQATNAGNAAQEAATAATGAAEAKTAAQTAQQAAETAKSGAEQAATTAQNAAQSAVSAKEAAETAKSGAESARDEVNQSANNAAGSASAAATSATSASASAQAAETAQTAAENAKSTAAQKATDATNASQTATSKATEAAEANAAAQTAKGEAQTAATNAGKSATAAAGSATTASNAATAAQTAQGKAETAQGEAEESAEAAAASAAAAEATKAEVEQKLANGDYNGEDGYTPIAGVDYPTDAQIDAKIAAALAERNQLEPLVAESAEWLNENGDPTKVYIVPNSDGQGGKVYAYAETETVLEPDNVLVANPSLGEQDINVGVVTGKRLSGTSGAESTHASAFATGFIPCDDDDFLTVTGWRGISGTSTYIIVYNASKARLASVPINYKHSDDLRFAAATEWATYDEATDTFVTKPLTSVMSTEEVTITGIAYARISGSVDVADTMEVYINKSSMADTVAAWYAFDDFIPTEDARIEELDRRLSVVENRVSTVNMRTWDKPVYDTTPVVLIGDDTDPTKAKPAIGDRETVQAVYDAYDALMADHPRYITRTPYKDNTVDGQILYRYDFQAPWPHKNSDGLHPISLAKPKIILISGIHSEWVGIWSLFHALEEIVTNPDLRDIRRNAHLIVVPVCNPYCLSGPYSATNGRKNANGVEIHRNFAVDHVVIDSTSDNYGGAEPLSEVESRFIDSILAANPDAVAFVSCHNFDGRNASQPFGTSGGGEDYGTTFMWASTATDYLYNLGGRFGVKMSEAWEDKYGDAWRNQIDAIVAARKAASLTYQPEGDYTVGTAGKSTTPGTEAKHCMLYGIQGMTFEVAGNMMALDSDNADSITITRGAEVYANLIATLLAVHDPADKKLCKYID